MNIRNLAKAIQDYVKDGCAYIAIFKNGRSWDYEILSVYSEEELQGDEELKKIYAIDKNVIVVHGYNDNFGTNSIADIEYRVRHNYETGIGQIYFIPTENNDTEDNSVEQAIDDFVKYCNDEISDEEYKSNAPKVIKTEFDAFHDITYYSDGSKDEYYIGD